MMASSKTWIYHRYEILYNHYKDNIFQNNKEIKIVSISAFSFIRYTANLGHCIGLHDAALKTYNIETLKKHLDKKKLKHFCHEINEE